MDNCRMRVIADGVIAERIALDTIMHYNPVTKSANVNFRSAEVIYVNGVAQPGNMACDQSLPFDAGANATRKFGAGLTDPVTGADLSNISVAGIDAYMKAAFSTLHHEYCESLIPPAITPED